MKKLIFSSITILFLSFQGQCKNLDVLPNTTNNSIIFPHIIIHIELGRPSLNCLGFGFCNGTIDIELKNINSNNFKASSREGKLIFSLNNDNLVLINEYFGSNSIILDEDFLLSDDIVKALGLKFNTIKKGTYPIKFNQQTKQNEINF